MFKDPIVEESRKAGNLLVAEAGNDKQKFIDNLRKKQYSSGRRPVPPPASRIQIARTTSLSDIRFSKTPTR